MNSTSKIVIKKSKSSMIWLALGSLLFVIGSVWILITEIIIYKIVAIVGIGFFGFALFFFIKELFSKSAGVIIDENGIYDESNAASVGLIEWKDIEGFDIAEISSQKFVLIFVSNPMKYIERAKNMLQKQTMTGNLGIVNTPITISPIALKCSLDEFQNIMIEAYKRYK